MKMTKIFMLFAVFCCLVGMVLCAGVAHAAPSVKISDKKDNVTIQEGVTAEILAQIKKDAAEEKNLVFRLDKIGSNDDLTKLCDAFPGMKELNIDGPKELTSVAPVAKLKNLTRFTLNGGTVADFSPLSDLTGLTNISIRGNSVENGMMAPDLKWMSKLTKLTSLTVGAPSKLRTLVSFEGIPSIPNLSSAIFTGGAPADLTPLQALSGLKKLELTGSDIADLTPLTGLPKLENLSLYGVTVKDFSPLAGCSALKILDVYASKGADYSTLGKLPQVRELNTGMTEIADISWIEGMTNLKKLQVFSEKIADYTPLAKIKLEDLTIWKMNAPANLQQISGVSSLKRLKLWNLKAGGFEGLASLVNMEELVLMGMNAKDGTGVDMAFAKSLVNLKKLEISGSEISNFDAVAGCSKLESVSIDAKSTGITSIEALKGLPNLKTLVVPKGIFPADQLTGYANSAIKVTER
jgi:Leucine-rich repeat (LRR) protein